MQFRNDFQNKFQLKTPHPASQDPDSKWTFEQAKFYSDSGKTKW